MNYHCAKLYLISFIFACTAQHCWSFSTVRMKKTPEQLALPRVTCSARRIRAVFGPLVKSNIHVKGKIAFSVATQPLKWLEIDSVQSAKSIVWIKNGLSAFVLNPSILCALCCFLRHDRGHSPSASVWGVLWSETGQGEKPEPLVLQQIWQLLCTDGGKNKGLYES